MMLSRQWLLIISIFLPSLILPFPQKASAESALNRAVVQNLRNIVRLIPQRRQARPARVADAMIPGDALSTGRASLAELRFNDGSLARIGEQAIFRFLAKTRRFNLSNGTVLLLIPPGRGVTGVQTPNAAAAIRGSALFVRYIPDTDTTIVGALTNSNIEVFNGTASQSQVLEAGQMAVVVENRIESLYEFDLDTFYETSDLVQQLDLNEPTESPNADPAIASVRAETAAAAATQAPVTGQGVIENPTFVQPPTIAPPQTPIDQRSPASPSNPATPSNTPANNDSALPRSTDDKTPANEPKPATPLIDDSTKLPSDNDKPLLDDNIEKPKLPLDDNTLPVKPLELDENLPIDDKKPETPPVESKPDNENKPPELPVESKPDNENKPPELPVESKPDNENKPPELPVESKPEVDNGNSAQPELPLDTPAATDAVEDNQQQLLENTTTNNPPEKEPEQNTPSEETTPDPAPDAGEPKTNDDISEPGTTAPPGDEVKAPDTPQPVEEVKDNVQEQPPAPEVTPPSQEQPPAEPIPATSVDSTVETNVQQTPATPQP